MFNKNVFGVDLGSSAIKIYSFRKNRLVIEHSMIAVRGAGQVIAAGNEAFEMYEKNPPDVRVDSPIVSGRIADVAEVEMLLRLLIRRTDRHAGRNPHIFFSAPVNMSEIEKKTYYAISHNSGMRSPRVLLVDKPICDAIAMDIPINKTRGSMIFNIGARSTDVSVISGGQIIVSDTLNLGGEMLSESICSEIRRSCNLMIGMRTARRLKAVLATFDREGNEARKVTGVDTVTGLPREEIITSDLVTLAVSRELQNAAAEARNFLERMPPQIMECIAEEGIYLAGGTARIPGIERFLSRITGCRINKAPDYEFTTVRGLMEIIRRKELRVHAYSIKGRR